METQDSRVCLAPLIQRLDRLPDSVLLKAQCLPDNQTTILSEEADPNKLHDLKATLGGYQVHADAEIDRLVTLYLGGADRDQLDPILDACVAVYKEQLDEDGQVDFKGKAKAFLRTYGFLASILPYTRTDAGLLDSHSFDEHAESAIGDFFDDGKDDGNGEPAAFAQLRTEEAFRKRAAEIYGLYADRYKRRFLWLGPHHFIKDLEKDLTADAGFIGRGMASGSTGRTPTTGRMCSTGICGLKHASAKPRKISPGEPRFAT